MLLLRLLLSCTTGNVCGGVRPTSIQNGSTHPSVGIKGETRGPSPAPLRLSERAGELAAWSLLCLSFSLLRRRPMRWHRD